VESHAASDSKAVAQRPVLATLLRVTDPSMPPYQVWQPRAGLLLGYCGKHCCVHHCQQALRVVLHPPRQL